MEVKKISDKEYKEVKAAVTEISSYNAIRIYVKTQSREELNKVVTLLEETPGINNLELLNLGISFVVIPVDGYFDNELDVKHYLRRKLPTLGLEVKASQTEFTKGAAKMADEQIKKDEEKEKHSKGESKKEHEEHEKKESKAEEKKEHEGGKDEKHEKETKKEAPIVLGDGAELKQEKPPKKVLELYEDGKATGVFVEPVKSDSHAEEVKEYREILKLDEGKKAEPKETGKKEEKKEEKKAPVPPPLASKEKGEKKMDSEFKLKFSSIEAPTPEESLDKSFFLAKSNDGKVKVFSAKSVIPVFVQKKIVAGDEEVLSPEEICEQIVTETEGKMDKLTAWISKRKNKVQASLKRLAMISHPEKLENWSVNEKEISKESPDLSVSVDEKEAKQNVEKAHPVGSPVKKYYNRLPAKSVGGEEPEMAIDKKSGKSVGDHLRDLREIAHKQKELEAQLKERDNTIRQQAELIEKTKQAEDIRVKTHKVASILDGINISDAEALRKVKAKLASLDDKTLEAVSAILPFMNKTSAENLAVNGIEGETNNENTNTDDDLTNSEPIASVNLDSVSGEENSLVDGSDLNKFSSLWAEQTLNKLQQ